MNAVEIEAMVQNRTASEISMLDSCVREDWMTPSGRPRAFPMYEIGIRNDFLRKDRLLKGQNIVAVLEKAQDQLMRWGAQETRARVTQAKRDAKERAFTTGGSGAGPPAQ